MPETPDYHWVGCFVREASKFLLQRSKTRMALLPQMCGKTDPRSGVGAEVWVLRLTPLFTPSLLTPVVCCCLHLAPLWNLAPPRGAPQIRICSKAPLCQTCPGALGWGWGMQALASSQIWRWWSQCRHRHGACWVRFPGPDAFVTAWALCGERRGRQGLVGDLSP